MFTMLSLDPLIGLFFPSYAKHQENKDIQWGKKKQQKTIP